MSEQSKSNKEQKFKGLKPKQQEILDYIKKEILQKGYPPTVREICKEVNLKSTSSVANHLDTLEERGYIHRDPTKPRAIEVLDDDFALSRREITNIPIVGRVAAGEPLLAVENIEDYFALPLEYIPSGRELYVLKVKGDSMVNAGIFENDLLIVQKQSSASNGDIVVALIDDSATVKRLYKEDGHIRLQPENDFMDPIIVDDCLILGKAVCLYRPSIF